MLVARLVPLVVFIACTTDHSEPAKNPSQPPPQSGTAAPMPAESKASPPKKPPPKVRTPQYWCNGICKAELPEGGVPDERIQKELNDIARCIGSAFDVIDVPKRTLGDFSGSVAEATRKSTKYRKECGYVQKHLKDRSIVIGNDLKFVVKNDANESWSSVVQYCICAKGRAEVGSFELNMIGDL